MSSLVLVESPFLTNNREKEKEFEKKRKVLDILFRIHWFDIRGNIDIDPLCAVVVPPLLGTWVNPTVVEPVPPATVVFKPPFVSSSCPVGSSTLVVSFKLKSKYVNRRKENESQSMFNVEEEKTTKSNKNLHWWSLKHCYFHLFSFDNVFEILLMIVLILFQQSKDVSNLLQVSNVPMDPIWSQFNKQWQMKIFKRSNNSVVLLETSTNKIDKIIIRCTKNLS